MSEDVLPVLVLGAGRSGVAAARLLLRGNERVVVYDRELGALDALDLGAEVQRIAGPEPPAFAAFSRVVASPGLALAPDPKLLPEVDLAAEHARAPIVGVTGTNGKSTCAVLISEMLRASDLAVAVGGNLGTALCELVDEQVDWIVAELSSFQLEHARRLRARVGVLLNLAPDHLDRHGTLEDYGAAKARLAELQRAEDALVINADDAWATEVASRSPARVIRFSSERVLPAGAFLDGAELVLRDDAAELLRMERDALAPACRAAIANALAASAAAHAAGARPEGIRTALASFGGLPHRAHVVCTRRGVTWIDDSKATNPAAAAVSLASQTRPTWWLAGGRNKGLDLAPLARAASGARAAIVYGEAAPALADALAGVTEVVRVKTLEEAVEQAARRAQPDEVVLLAPACASFDQFASFEERGDRFAALARALPC